MPKKFILDMDLPSWEEYMKEKGYPKFRASQVFSWCSKGVIDLDKMSKKYLVIIGRDTMEIFERQHTLCKLCGSKFAA